MSIQQKAEFMSNLITGSVLTRVSNAAAAGTSNINCTSVDMAGYDKVTFIASFGTLTATQVTGLKLQESSDNSSFADVTSGATAAMADGDSNKVLMATYSRPAKRYVRVVVTRGTANAVVDGVIALQYSARTIPVTQSSNVSASVTVTI